MTVDLLILSLGWMVPCGVLIGLLHGRNWLWARKKLRMPVAEKLLRSPGENLRKKLEELEEQISGGLAILMVFSAICTGGILLLYRHQQTAPRVQLAGYTTVAVIAYVVLCRNLFRSLDKRRNYRLGLSGELAVGEELNRLMLKGCHVFHDVPNDPYGNVDHVVVAPSGVYAVETKTRRKQERQGKETHKVAFTGR